MFNPFKKAVSARNKEFDIEAGRLKIYHLYHAVNEYESAIEQMDLTKLEDVRKAIELSSKAGSGRGLAISIARELDKKYNTEIVEEIFDL